MKALNELYTEVAASDALKAEFLALKTPEEIVAFAKKNDCDATLNEIKAFFEEKQKAAGELSEEDLEQVAGGKSKNDIEAYLSLYSAGLVCAFVAGVSAIFGKVGTAIEGEGMLCSTKGNRDSDLAGMGLKEN